MVVRDTYPNPSTHASIPQLQMLFPSASVSMIREVLAGHKGDAAQARTSLAEMFDADPDAAAALRPSAPPAPTLGVTRPDVRRGRRRMQANAPPMPDGEDMTRAVAALVLGGVLLYFLRRAVWVLLYTALIAALYGYLAQLPMWRGLCLLLQDFGTARGLGYIRISSPCSCC